MICGLSQPSFQDSRLTSAGARSKMIRCLFEAPLGKLTLGASCIRWLSIYGLVKGPNLIQAR